MERKMNNNNVFKASLIYRDKELTSGFYTQAQMDAYLALFSPEIKKHFVWNILGEATKVVSVVNLKKDMHLIQMEDGSWRKEETRVDFMGKIVCESEEGVKNNEVEDLCFINSEKNNHRFWSGYVLKEKVKPERNNFHYCLLGN